MGWNFNPGLNESENGVLPHRSQISVTYFHLRMLFSRYVSCNYMKGNCLCPNTMQCRCRGLVVISQRIHNLLSGQIQASYSLPQGYNLPIFWYQIVSGLTAGLDAVAHEKFPVSAGDTTPVIHDVRSLCFHIGLFYNGVMPRDGRIQCQGKGEVVASWRITRYCYTDTLQRRQKICNRKWIHWLSDPDYKPVLPEKKNLLQFIGAIKKLLL
jgi:hypothetical protein